MGASSKIEWTEATWNPIVGCSRVSEGCRNCYAEAVAGRFSAPNQPYHGVAELKVIGGAARGRWTGEIRFVEKHLDDPLRWRRPRRVFVNSMSDLFHEKVTDDMLLLIFTVMANTHIAVSDRKHLHTFQILTKRPARMLSVMRRLKWKVGLALSTFNGRNYMFNYMPYFEKDCWTKIPNSGPQPPKELPGHVLPNVWLGVSVEDQKTADERIPLLLRTPAAVRWVSYEPALGPVDFDSWPKRVWLHVVGDDGSAERGRIDWIVCGGESGPGARPMKAEWARSARDQCVAAGVPYFMKQMGGSRTHNDVPIPEDLLIKEYPHANR